MLSSPCWVTIEKVNKQSPLSTNWAPRHSCLNYMWTESSWTNLYKWDLNSSTEKGNCELGAKPASSDLTLCVFIQKHPRLLGHVCGVHSQWCPAARTGTPKSLADQCDTPKALLPSSADCSCVLFCWRMCPMTHSHWKTLTSPKDIRSSLCLKTSNQVYPSLLQNRLENDRMQNSVST